jgi:hypothetical protein
MRRVTPDRCHAGILQPPGLQPAPELEDPTEEKDENSFFVSQEPHSGQIGFCSAPDFWSLSKWQLHFVQLYSNIGIFYLLSDFVASKIYNSIIWM